MRFLKRGLVYRPPFDGSWRDNSALTPTPILLDDNTLRIYSGFRDKSGISRIGYVDVQSDDPTLILNISDKPVLDIGEPGMFDDNGMIMGDIIIKDNQTYMYYVGFQLVDKVKFLAYSGLAIKYSNSESFRRYRNTPIFDRGEEAMYIRAIHSAIAESGIMKIWYAVGNGWEQINGKRYPQYEIYHSETDKIEKLPQSGTICIGVDRANCEYRIGRPRVYKWKEKYLMLFTYGTTDGRYMAGMATSTDGISWNRDDSKLGIQLSENGWDSVHLCYPALITVNDKTYMFYNGNNMGYDGFGVAEMIDDSI
jgi:hypothetical protein